MFIFWNVLDVFFGNMHVLMFFVLLLDLCLERCECMFFFFGVCFCFFRIRDHLGICLGDFEVPSMSPGSEFYISARGYIVTI